MKSEQLPEPGCHDTVTPVAEIARAAQALETPCFVLDEASFIRNGEILADVARRSGAKILLAQKAFSTTALYPTLRKYLCGTTASGLHEARLGAEYFGGEVHVYSPAFKEAEIAEVAKMAHHVVFNSLNQWRRHRDAVENCSVGLRINPEYSEAAADLYDPCAKGSRFGMLDSQLEGENLTGIDGLHFHTLCEQGAGALRKTVVAVIKKFHDHLLKIQWINLGGGHLITSPGYDIDGLLEIIKDLQSRYPQLTIYLEPGEAAAVGAGVLIGSVIDITENGGKVAVLDVSATTHMPDVLEMPYRPTIVGAGEAGEKKHTYRLGGPTCLAGDVIGDYSFATELSVGDRLVFTDMAHYTIVKTTTFNGVPLPSISVLRGGGELETVREFTYEDFRNRLG